MADSASSETVSDNVSQDASASSRLGVSDIFSDSDLTDIKDSPARRGLPWLVASGLLAVVGVSGWLGYARWRQQAVDPVMVPTAPVTQQTLENRVTAAGTVELGNQQTLTAPDDVTVEAVLVEERQRVDQGTVLLELRSRELQQKLLQQQQQEEVDLLSLQRAQEMLQEKHADRLEAQNELAESQGLLEEGFISEDEYKEDLKAVDQAESAIKDAELELRRAEITLEQNRTEIANLRSRLLDNQIRAPFDAVVLHIAVEAGNGVTREKPLLTLGDPRQEMIRFQLLTTDANQVRVGMPVHASVIGPNSAQYSGRVAWISPQAGGEEEGRSFSGGGQPMVDAMAILEEPSGELIPGSTVNLEIIVNQRQDVLAIPPHLVQSDDGVTQYVWVRDLDGRAQRREIETGLETLEGVEAISGLEEGDELIMMLPEQPLEPGMVLTAPGEVAE